MATLFIFTIATCGTDVIVNPKRVFTGRDGIVDAMEVDASSSAIVDINVIDANTDAIIDAADDIEVVGTNAIFGNTNDMGEEALINRGVGIGEIVLKIDIVAQDKAVCQTLVVGLAIDVHIVHDGVLTDVEPDKLEKTILSTSIIVDFGIDAIADYMVVDAKIDGIVNAIWNLMLAKMLLLMINGIANAMEVDVSTTTIVDNVNDAGTDIILDAANDIEVMGTNSIFEDTRDKVDAKTNVIANAMEVDSSTNAVVDCNLNDASTDIIIDADDLIVDAAEAVGIDANIRDRRAHTQGKLIEASSQQPPGQATTQSPLARPPKHTPRKPPSSKAPLKRLPIEPANKKRKKRGREKSVSSEGDEDIEEDPDNKEIDDVLDIDSQPIENLDGEDGPLGDLPDPLPKIDITEELWDHVDDHTCGTEPDPQHLFVLIDLRELQREIGDGQCQHAGLGSIRMFLGSLTRMGVMDAQAALGGVQLSICNFSTNTRPNTGVCGVPSWNTYADDLAEVAFTVAYEFMVTGGVVIALCMPEQYITIVREAHDSDFELIWTMYLHMNAPMFILREDYTKPVSYLI
ncbi:hypothetical protein L7F22_034305 [Adiantum nelumboides]|nr:hypothetical protein [Adiantum nelumboides]